MAVWEYEIEHPTLIRQLETVEIVNLPHAHMCATHIYLKIEIPFQRNLVLMFFIVFFSVKY